MSKAIVSLKKMPSKDDILNEHIINTYFSQKIRKKKNKDVIKIKKVTFLAPILLVVVSLLIGISLFLNNRYTKFLKEKAANSKVITMFDGGRINREIIDDFEFRGYAKGNAKFSNKLIVFNNPKKYNWADISLDFKFPVDFSKRYLLLSLKGKIGGEKITLVLRDINNRSYRLKDIYLSSNWTTETIPINNLKENIDLSKISHLRFECGYVGETGMDSAIDVTIYIRKIQILKEG